jgi:hypothetical protein
MECMRRHALRASELVDLRWKQISLDTATIRFRQYLCTSAGNDWSPRHSQRHHDHRRKTTSPPPQFGGVIKEDAKDSRPWWPLTVVPPKGAPNLLLIMTDDSGYGVPGTFGSVIRTPALDRIANAGLR